MSIDNEHLNRTAKLQKLMRDPVAVLALISENEALRKALQTIREESHDIRACECAADALADAAISKEEQS